MRKLLDTILNFFKRYFFFDAALPYYTPIVDISKWQGDVDFELMKAAGVELVIMRGSIGGNGLDDRFYEYYAGARAAGLLVGVYHVVVPDQAVLDQWYNLLDVLGGRALDIPLILDCEREDGQNPSTIAACIEGLAQKVNALWNEYPVIYTRATWWNAHTIYKPIFKLCALWIARYWSGPHPWNDAPATLKPRDWNDFALWQYSADGNGLGEAYGASSDDIDLNYGGAETLQGTLTKLRGLPFPPPPTGDDDVKNCKNVALTDWLNIRVKPTANSLDVGNFYKNQTCQYFPALTKVVKPDLPNKEIWRLCVQPDGTAGWVAEWHPTIKNAQGQQYQAVIDL